MPAVRKFDETMQDIRKANAYTLLHWAASQREQAADERSRREWHAYWSSLNTRILREKFPTQAEAA